MFVKAVTENPFVTGTADQIFENIPGLTFRGDLSWTSTARALLGTRLKDGEKVRPYYQRRTYTNDDLRGLTAANFMDACVGSRTKEKDVFAICSFDRAVGENEASFALTDKYFEGKKGFTRLEDVELFVKKICQARFYINEENKSAFIFIESMNMRLWHLIQSLITRCMPWYFPKEGEGKIDDEELALIRSLTFKHEPSYIEALEKLAGRFDFRTREIKALFTGFEKKFFERRLRNLEDEIRNHQNRLREYLDRYDQEMRLFRDKETMKYGLLSQSQSASENSELMEYLISNKQIDIVEVRDARIDLIARSYIDNFDPDMFNVMIENDRSAFFVNYYDNGDKYDKTISVEQKRMLMKSIFDEGLIKLRVCAAFSLDNRDAARAHQNYNYSAKYDTYAPNQHIQHYACLGNNRRYIDEALKNSDYITAIEQCISVTRNMNLAEGNTVSFFMTDIYTNGRRCLELPDGSCVNAKEAVAWLEKTKEGKA